MKRRLMKGLYKLTGNLGHLFIEMSGMWPWGEYLEWPYRTGNWFYNRHYEIALKYRFWKLNPAWTEDGDEPRYIDADYNAFG